ncbi:MAG: DUF4159 domain-containing protein [Phycisphaeraceae bacterium]|nr:DUF4159 domain-containing protein [Phycisphaeraceae bacterium]
MALFAVLLVSPAFAQSVDGQVTLDQAIEQLVTEAAGIARLDDVNAKPTFDRPHKLIADWDAEAMAPLLFKRLTTGKLAGNPYGDAYVRWHLQPVIADAFAARFEHWKQTGQFQVRPEDARAVLSMLQSLPPEPDFEWRDVDSYQANDPKKQQELEDTIRKLARETRVKIGVPPFERYVSGRSALEFVDGEQKKQIEQIIKQIDDLRRQQMHRVTDPTAKAYNERLSELNKLLRESRSNLLYNLIQTGDKTSLGLIASEIDKQIKGRQFLGILLMRDLYVAMYDGYLLLYDEPTLSALRQSLLQTAQSADAAQAYLNGIEPLPSWMKPRSNNFADLAFHMIHLLETPATLQKFRDALEPIPEKPLPPRPSSAASADNLTNIRLHYAIERAVRQIYAPSQDNDILLPRYHPLTDSQMYQIMRWGANTPALPALINESGHQALLCWAMLRAGESYQNPHFYRRMSFVLATETPYTFDRAMRLMMLANLAPIQWQDWFERDYDWLLKAYDADKTSGALTDEYNDKGPSDQFSNAQAQYGTLGLWAVERSGRKVPDKLWQIIDNYWRSQQHKPSSPTSGSGWSVGLIDGPHKLKADDTNKYALEVQGPMTAAATMALSLSERRLYADKLLDADAAAKLPNLPSGLRWLDQNFSLTAHPQGTNWYHYLWTIQQLAHANGLRKLNGIDLFRDVTASILNDQRADGTWEDVSLDYSKGNFRPRRDSRTVSTAFALLYLSDAVAANVTISKLQFDGHWNNRPHDLWNFAEFAGSRYETNCLWQIVDAQMPVEHLVESPLIYLSTDAAFTLPEAQLKTLRDYIEAGGMLLLNSEKTSPDLAKAMTDLCGQLVPDQQLVDVPADHAFFSLHRPVNAPPPLRMVHNGVRPLIVQFQRDIGRDLQTPGSDRSGGGSNSGGGSISGGGPTFDLLGNIYLFAVGMNTQRRRLDNGHLIRNTSPTINSLRIDRLLAAPEPAADAQLRIYMANEHQLDLTIDASTPDKLGAGHRLALLSIAPGQSISDVDAKTIHDWCAAGGTLWLDAAGGSPAAIEAADVAVAKIFPQMRLIPIPFDSPILTGQGLPGGHDNTRVRYRSNLLRQIGPTSSPRLQALRLDGRIVMIYSPEDLTAAAAGLPHWSILGYDTDSARNLLANAVLSAIH